MRHRLPDRIRIRVLVRVRPYQPVIAGQLHPGAVRGGSACEDVGKARAMQGARLWGVFKNAVAPACAGATRALRLRVFV